MDSFITITVSFLFLVASVCILNFPNVPYRPWNQAQNLFSWNSSRLRNLRAMKLISLLPHYPLLFHMLFSSSVIFFCVYAKIPCPQMAKKKQQQQRNKGKQMSSLYVSIINSYCKNNTCVWTVWTCCDHQSPKKLQKRSVFSHINANCPSEIGICFHVDGYCFLLPRHCLLWLLD